MVFAEIRRLASVDLIWIFSSEKNIYPLGSQHSWPEYPHFQ